MFTSCLSCSGSMGLNLGSSSSSPTLPPQPYSFHWFKFIARFFFFFFFAIFLDSYVQGKRRKEVSWNPCKAPTLTGQTTITGRIPYSFRTVMWVLYRPLLNHDREDAGDGTYGLSSLSEKTRKSTLLQML